MLVERGPVKAAIELICLPAQIFRVDNPIERTDNPVRAEQPIDRGWLVDPSPRQCRREMHALLRDCA